MAFSCQKSTRQALYSEQTLQVLRSSIALIVSNATTIRNNRCNVIYRRDFLEIPHFQGSFCKASGWTVDRSSRSFSNQTRSIDDNKINNLENMKPVNLTAKIYIVLVLISKEKDATKKRKCQAVTIRSDDPFPLCKGIDVKPRESKSTATLMYK